jgi:hypothetical protein
MDDKRKDERRQPLSDAEKVQLGTVLPQEQRETDRRNEESGDRDAPITDDAAETQ